jgi:hypothetical protein
MNHKSTIVAGFLAASAAFFGIAHAAGPGCDYDGKPGMMRGAMHGGMMDPGARVEQRLTRLKSELKITAEQEPLWQAFAEKSKSEAGKGMQGMRERMQDSKPVSAPDRLAQMQGHMKERLVALESVSESFNRLYAGLTPEQKATADKHFSAMGRHQHGLDRGTPQRKGRAAPAAAAPGKS